MAISSTYIWQDIADAKPARLWKDTSKSEVVDVPSWHCVVVEGIPALEGDSIVFQHESQLDIASKETRQIKFHIAPSIRVKRRYRGSSESMIVILNPIASAVDFLIRSTISSLIVASSKGDTTRILDIKIDILELVHNWIKNWRARGAYLNIGTIRISVGWILT